MLKCSCVTDWILSVRQGVSLYVCNLPYSFSEQQLYRAFSPFGSIISAKV
ncbi:MAG: hypothetical protein ACRC6N_10560 [Plesiomonas sp.]